MLSTANHPICNEQKALDLVHSCNQKSSAGISRLKALIDQSVSLSNQLHGRRRAQAAAHVPEDREDPIAKRRAQARANQRPEALRPHPNTRPIESRPNLQVSRKRHIPVFVNARGLPFLRISKPQSPRLNRALKSILDMRWKRITRRDQLRENIDFAEDEDTWDSIIEQQAAQEDRSTEQGRERVDYDTTSNTTWARHPKQCLYETHRAIETGDIDTAARAERLWDVVLKEQELAKAERAAASPRNRSRRAR